MTFYYNDDNSNSNGGWGTLSQSVYTLDKQTYLIDCYDLSMSKRTGAYVLKNSEDETFTIIETGPSMSIPHIKNGLMELNLPLDKLSSLIITHIHLDHAGGAGLLLQDCPNATVYVHPKGARHLADPSQLIQGAKAVYGEKFNILFDPVLPVKTSQIYSVENEESLQLSQDRKLTFLHTPGHAKHHISIYDSETGTIFTGDTVGIRYTELEKSGLHLYLPSTSPNQFDPDKMLLSLETIMALKPSRIAFGHFGTSNDIQQIEEKIRFWLTRFMTEGQLVYEKGGDDIELATILFDEVIEFLATINKGMEKNEPFIEMIRLDTMISAMGILDYLKKNDNLSFS